MITDHSPSTFLEQGDFLKEFAVYTAFLKLCSLRPKRDSRVICVCVWADQAWSAPVEPTGAKMKTHVCTQWHTQGCSHSLSEWLSNIFSSLCLSRSLSLFLLLCPDLTHFLSPRRKTFPVFCHIISGIFPIFVPSSLYHMPSKSSQIENEEIKSQTAGNYLWFPQAICLYHNEIDKFLIFNVVSWRNHKDSWYFYSFLVLWYFIILTQLLTSENAFENVI